MHHAVVPSQITEHADSTAGQICEAQRTERVPLVVANLQEDLSAGLQ